MPQLEAEIAQLNEALRQRQQIGVATDLLAQRFTISSERGWTVAAEKLTTKTVALLTQDQGSTRTSYGRLSGA
jgi:hypothetical protein